MTRDLVDVTGAEGQLQSELGRVSRVFPIWWRRTAVSRSRSFQDSHGRYGSR